MCRPAPHSRASTLLPAPFFSEVPDDLACAAAWLDRDLMRSLLDLRHFPPIDEPTGARHDCQHRTPPAPAPVSPRDRSAEGSHCL
ncbi:hypothetical protein RA210_U170008 [Rubrivivax sp. A210]|nr:hypothetical protein RA210_U170008 [Rubrivivax sp. A210]